MKFGSVCSGIEAASVAWEPLGWEAAWFSEIEPFPCAVLAHHYPDTPNLGDMTALPDRIRSGEVEAPDLFCGGTPCQAFSVAGLRKSLDDARGNLSLTFCEIANAIDRVRQQPAIIFWENVPGVLSTKDNAFGCFLGALAGEDDALIPPGGRWANAGFVDGPQRAVAWRVLDAQYFGVAQRRRRVFVVASARNDFDPAAVLFEFEGLRRDSAPSREKGEAVAPTVTGGAPFSRTGNERVEIDAVSMCLNAGAMGRLDAESETLLPVAATLDASDGRKWGSNQWINQGKAIIQPVAFHPTQDDLISSTEICHSIGANENATAAVATPINTQMAMRGPDTSNTTREGLGVGNPGDPAFTLQAAHHHAVATAMQVRRLTPVECERLQGFPDNYTAIPWRKKPASECPDGPRYKALGNSWAVPAVRWIGERIARVA